MVAFGVIMAALVKIPPSTGQAQTDELREAVDLANRQHTQILGLLAGPTLEVDGKMPPVFEKGTEETIRVLSRMEQNTAIPGRIDKLLKELKTAIDAAPEAAAEAKSAAYAVTAQLQAAGATYDIQSAKIASAQAERAMADIDTGIRAVQDRLVNLKQIAPLTQTQDNVAGKMQADAKAKVESLGTAIAEKKAEIAQLQKDRAASLAAATKYSNEASELRTLSAVAQREERLRLQEDSFKKEKLANKAGLDAEDAQIKIDAGNAAVAMMTIEQTNAESAASSAAAVLAGFAKKRTDAKGKLDEATAGLNATGQELARKVDELIAACAKIDAGQASATQQYATAMEAVKKLREHASPSDAESIGTEAGVLVDRAWASLATISSRQAVGEINTRLKALWETSGLAGDSPKAAELAAFSDQADAQKTSAAADFAAAAKLYEEATLKSDRYKWNFQLCEYRVLKARFWLTEEAKDGNRAALIRQELEELKGFPYIDKAL